MIKYKHPIKREPSIPLSGKYFLIDGNLIIEQGLPNDMGLHKIMFEEKIVKQYPKYKNYSYLYFPRGIVMFMNDEDKTSIISGPKNLTSIKQRRIARSFESYKYKWQPDEHYDLEFTLKKIQDDLESFGPDAVKFEKTFIEDFFNNQLEIFTGKKNALLL